VSMLYILGAWIFWGTYPVPFKSPSAKKANCDPFAFQYMKSAMVCITSWLILTWRPFTFTYWGFAGAAMWIPAGLLFITSVKLTGVAFAAPIANGTQVIVSFCWGAFYFKEEVHSAGLSVLAMFIMILGMIGISIAVNWESMQAARLLKQQRQYSINVTAGTVYEETPLLKDEKQPAYEPTEGEGPKSDKKRKEEFRRFIYGITVALCSGLFGGTQNVPLKYAPPDAHGIQYTISFGIGAVCVITVFTLVYCIIRWCLDWGLPTVNLKLSLLPGSIAGALWSCGNVCNIYVTLTYGVTVGFPIVMCNMMVAGCWGVFYYNEAPNIWMKVLFVFSCAVLLGGVTLLSFFG